MLKNAKSDQPQEASFVCFLCGQSVDVKRTKRGKPYFICDPCGLQAFIRREKGITKFRHLSKTLGRLRIGKSALRLDSFEIMLLVNRLWELERRNRELKKRGKRSGQDIVQKELELEILKIEDLLTGKARGSRKHATALRY